MMKQILSLDPARYTRHAIHGENRVWAETNCYVDVWVELLHAWGFDPVAALPFTLGWFYLSGRGHAGICWLLLLVNVAASLALLVGSRNWR